MTVTPLIAPTPERLPVIRLEVDGQGLDPVTAGRVHSLEVDLRDDGPSAFTVTFAHEGTGAGGLPEIPISEGMSLQITVQHGGRVARLLTGVVTAVSVAFDGDGASLWTVEGFDRLHALSYGTRTTVYVGPDQVPLRDAQIVALIGQRHNLKVAYVGAETVPVVARVQNSESDLRFLQRLAALTCKEVWIDARGFLRVQPTRTSPGVPAVLSLGENVVSFSNRVSLPGQVGTVRAHVWDQGTKSELVRDQVPASVKSMTATQRRLVTGTRLDVTWPSVIDARAAEALAEAVAADVSRDLNSPSVVVLGDPQLQVGSTVLMRKAGRFSGSYQVIAARHAVSAEGYLTYAQLTSATGAAAHRSRAVARSSPPVAVVPAIVTAVEDPENRGRVQVRLAEGTETDAFWVRLLAPAAGTQRGVFWPPTVDDEVLLLAAGPDLTAGYVIGSLWSSKDRPPEPAAGATTRRTLRTASGALIRFDDTKGAERIEIIASDGATKVLLDGANGAVTVHAAQDLTLEAPAGTLRLSGSKVEVTSTTGTKIGSDASAELSGTGGVTIRGSRVDIN